MSRVLLFREIYAYTTGNGKFYSVGFNNAYFERYLQIADELVCFFRYKQCSEDAIPNYAPLDNPAFTIVTYNNLNTFKDIIKHGGDVKKKLSIELTQSDHLVVTLPSIMGSEAIGIARRLGKPYLVELTNCAWDSLWNYNWKGKLLAPFLFLWTKRLVRDAPYVSYVSRGFLQKRYPTKGISVGCPDVYLPEPQNEVLGQRIERINSMSRDQPVVLGLVGALDVRYRGHRTAIRALARLKDRQYRYKLIFLGSGDPAPLELFAEQYGVQDCIEYCAPLPSGDPVMQWLDGIDVLVMPTRAETLGRAVVEAMSRGCPVLGSVETGIADQVGADCLFPARDDRILSKLIAQMTEDRDFMLYCAYENFYRSFKYSNKQTDKTRSFILEELSGPQAKGSK